MDYFTKKQIKDFNNKIKKIFNLLSITGKYRVIGSAGYKSVLYSSDYDLNEEFNAHSSDKSTLDHLYHMFKDKFKTSEQNPNIFITDFKCGIDTDGEPLRWDKFDMRRGFKILKNGVRLSFQEALLIKATTKMDIITLVNGVFTEFSENYYIKLGEGGNYSQHTISEDHILDALKTDYENYLTIDNNYWKALKRLFAYKSLLNSRKYKKQLIDMLEFFNSTTGIVNKSKSELDILLLVVDNKFRKPKMEDILNNLQIIKQNLSSVFDIDLGDVSGEIDYICSLKSPSRIRTKIENLKNHLLDVVNKCSKDYIIKNKNLFI